MGCVTDYAMWCRAQHMVLICIVVLALKGVGSADGQVVTYRNCRENALISKLDVVQPAPNTLVHSTYYTKMSAEILLDAELFRQRQREFHLCANATVQIDEGPKEVFSECGRSVFGQGRVLGKEGVNSLVLTLFHNAEQLCQVQVIVVCCLNAELATAQASAKEAKARADFVDLGTQMVQQIASFTSSNAMPLSRSPAVDRLQNYFEAWNYIPGDPSQSNSITGINVLIGIKSSAMNLIKRNNIRATWLRETELENSMDSSVRIIPYFLLGKSSVVAENATFAHIIEQEHSFYRDTLVHELSAEDSYFTLGEKVLAFAAWSRQHTQQAGWPVHFVVICDDDVFVDLWQLKQHLLSLPSEQELSSHARGYYAGEVLEVRMHEKYHPIRDPQHRNYLPSTSYPLDTLPPFALGNFYILSEDLWDYLGRNSDILRPTGTLEDLSVGIWMLGLQVFPTHLSGVCDITRCLYDTALYRAHPTYSAGSYPSPATHPQRLLAVADLQHRADFDLLYRMTTHRAEHGLGNTQAALNLTQATVAYILNKGSSVAADTSSTTSPTAVVEPAKVAEEVNVVITTGALYAFSFVKRWVSTAMESALERSAPVLRLWAVEPHSQRLYELNTEGDVVGEVALEGSHLGAEDTKIVILVASVLDCAVRDATAVEPSQQLRWSAESQTALDKMRSNIGATRTVLISGEPIDLSAARAPAVDVVISSAFKASWMPHSESGVLHHYVPVVAMAFHEMAGTIQQGAAQRPADLLRSSAERAPDVCDVNTASPSATCQSRRGVAYLYHRCDRPHREIFFDLLSTALPPGEVVALGRCSGAQSSLSPTNHAVRARSSSRVDSRFSAGYLTEAIDLYASFRFVVAFENSAVEGYITEKILTAYLAGAVPIYYGAPDVAKLFNPDSFIDCGALLDNLQECVERVVEVYNDPVLYTHMRAAPPVVNITAWEEVFAWENRTAASEILWEFWRSEVQPTKIKGE